MDSRELDTRLTRIENALIEILQILTEETEETTEEENTKPTIKLGKKANDT